MDHDREKILIFVYRITARMRYIFGFLFGILGVPFRFTTKLEEFVAYNGPKFSYTSARLGNEFHIRATGLLEEKGVRNRIPDTTVWNDLPALFPAPQNASLPFDLFSAAFYLLTRYEEYLPFTPDEHGRFPHEQSLAHRLDFLDRPLIDLWVEAFKKTFAAHHENLSFPAPPFKFRPLLSVSISHLFKHKGLVRQIGGLLDNLAHLDFKHLRYRLQYAFTRKRDPYDTFYKFIALKKQFRHDWAAFFPVSPFSDYDRNLPLTRPAYRRVIKTVSDYADTGLIISYHHAYDAERIKQERKALENILHKPVQKVRFHYYRQRLPHSCQILYREEFGEDFSCGYPKAPGFRASTAYPFPFYDLSEEEITGLTVHPIVLTDYHLNFILGLSPEEAIETVRTVGQMIRRTGGYFQPVFHNSILSEFEEWKGWSQVYVKTLEMYAN